MIINVPYKPTWLSPVYNPIMWSVLSSKVNSQDFKYVFEIYLDDVLINTIKQRANPAGYGMLDVSALLQGYLEGNATNAAITQGETSIDYNSGKVFADNNLMSRKVYLKVGEEYTVNGITTIYNGTSDTPGAPAFYLFSGNTQFGNLYTPVTTWSASITDQEQQWNMQSTYQSGIFGGNPFYGNTVYDHAYGLASALNFSPLEQDVYSFDNTVLSFLNWTPTIADNQQKPIYGFRFTRYDAGGTQINTVDKPMITANGFGMRSTCTSTVPLTLDPKYAIVHVLAGPDKLATALGWSTIMPGERITIAGYSKGSTGCDLGNQITKEYGFTIQEYCTPLYPRVRLSWYNALGGRDYQNFTMFLEKTTNTTQDNYAQEQMNFSGATPVPVLNGSLPIGTLGIKGGDKPFNKQSTLTYSVQTDWLTQDYVNILEGLQKSPQVLAYIADPLNQLANDYPYTVKITQSSYTTKNVRQNKMVQGTFTFTLVSSQKMQNL